MNQLTKDKYDISKKDLECINKWLCIVNKFDITKEEIENEVEQPLDNAEVWYL